MDSTLTPGVMDLIYLGLGVVAIFGGLSCGIQLLVHSLAELFS